MKRSAQRGLWLLAVLVGANLFAVAPARAHLLGMLEVAAYDVSIVDRALEAQAWVILGAAAAHAEQHGGLYPERVADFAERLPRRELMENVWTGARNVPSDARPIDAGSIGYEVLYAYGKPVGCRVIAIGRFGEKRVLVSDRAWARQHDAPLQLSLAR